LEVLLAYRATLARLGHFESLQQLEESTAQAYLLWFSHPLVVHMKLR